LAQPAHEKLLNRRIRAGALTTAPSFVYCYPHDHRADPMPFDYGLAIGQEFLKLLIWNQERTTKNCSAMPLGRRIYT
jgi:hypothetical protein